MAVHEALEAVDALGVVPIRDHRANEPLLGWVDATFGGVASSEVAAGGVWVFERAGHRIGLASYDLRGLAYHWLRFWNARSGIATLGPFGLIDGDGRVVPGRSADERLIERALLHAALASVRERGYRQAVVPVVTDPERLAFYEREAGARFVESVDLGRGGRRFRTTVLASGNGSNFEAVAHAAAEGALPLDLVRLVVNRPAAVARDRARRLGVPEEVVAWARGSESRERFDERVTGVVAATEPDLVLMLGWMHVMPATFVARFPQIANLHPAFLPLDPAADRVTMPDGTSIAAFRGAHAVDDALAAGAPWFGATLHRVGVAVDRGAVLARAPLPLGAGRSREALEAELHAAERRTLLAGLNRWACEMP